MKLKNHLHVISATHWDREWRFPLDKTRMHLVAMMDALLDVLENNPDFRYFHLDGQTVLLDDYAEDRPENVARIRKLVKAGRLLIGPWYTLPEVNQLSGESIVRNFLWGEKTGSKYGGTMKVGYSPTSWGQVSQMPQIMAGCGISSILFYRGISADQIPGHFYLWEGPDKTRLLGVKMGNYARSGFFHLVNRPVVFNRGRKDQTHDWALGGKPFRLTGVGSRIPYHFFEAPRGWHPERIEEAFADLEETDLGQWETPFALAMESQDSIGAFEETPRIIAEARRRVTNGKQIKHSSLPAFMRAAKRHLAGRRIPVVKGEMRHPLRQGVWTDLYAEVQACRIPLKAANRRAEFAVQRVAEPLATAAWMLGEAYPERPLERANRLLLQSHAHDSIGGCGCDEVSDDVEARFRHVQILCEGVSEEAARAIAGRIDTSRLPLDNILVVVFNTLPYPRTCVTDAEVDTDKRHNVRALRLETLDGQPAAVQPVKREDCLAIFNHPQELPLRADMDRWSFRFEAENIPAMGYRVFRAVPAKPDPKNTAGPGAARLSLENEHLTVSANQNGTVNIRCKATGRMLREQNLFHDRGDVGDYWIGAFPRRDRIVTSRRARARWKRIEDGPLSGALEAKLVLRLPVGATKDGSARARRVRSVPITTQYRLVKKERFLRVTTTVDNTVEDHILTARFPTDLATDTAHAETAFDVVARPIPLPDTRGWKEPYKPVQPHRNFVDLSDRRHGVALLNRGLPQYEAVDDPRRTLSLTLIRAHRAWNSVRLARYTDEHGTQLQGAHTLEYAILPHQGDWDSGHVMREAEAFNVSPLIGCAGPGKGDLPDRMSFLELKGDGLVLSALKKGEWDDAVIVRVFNPTARTILGRLVFANLIRQAEIVNLLETRAENKLSCQDGMVSVRVKPKKIVTVRIRLGKSLRPPSQASCR